MNKKDKLFLLIFILSCLSILIAIPLKLLGMNLFGLKIYSINIPINIEYIINTIMLIIEFYLIVGCITLFEPKKLAIKILPFLPLNILLYYFPKNMHIALCFIIILATCMSLRPMFSTLLLLFSNLFLIFIIQLALIWLKLDIKTIIPIFPNIINMIILHIDEFIILGFLYFANRKWGEKYAKLVLFWRNG